MKKFLYKGSVIVIAVFQVLTFTLGINPNTPSHKVYAANALNQAYVTLSNSRLSYKGAVATSGYVNSTTINTASSSQPDNDTANLFPNDSICFNTTGYVCHNNVNHTITNIVGANQFTFTPAETNTIANATAIVASQSALLAVTFKVTTTVPVGGNVKIYIPGHSTQATAQDGMPDQTGFDSACLGVGGANPCAISSGSFNSDVAVTGFTKGTAAYSYSTPNHIVTVPVASTALTSGNTYVITIGGTAANRERFVLPAPASTHTTRGVADSYNIRIATDNGSTTLDDTTVVVAPNDGVLVSTTVPLALTWKINDAANPFGGNIGSGQSVCSLTTSVGTTATTVPFGTITTNTFYVAAQSHYISTNASNGYNLTVYATSPVAGGALAKADGSASIANGTCDGACTTTSAGAWATATNNGFGYTLANETGTDAAFTSNYKIFDGTADGASAVTIMSNAGAVSGNRIYVCYKLSVSGTQAAGFYFNNLNYVATPKF
jgi:hypothetical protein